MNNRTIKRIQQLAKMARPVQDRGKVVDFDIKLRIGGFDIRGCLHNAKATYTLWELIKWEDLNKLHDGAWKAQITRIPNQMAAKLVDQAIAGEGHTPRGCPETTSQHREGRNG